MKKKIKRKRRAKILLTESSKKDRCRHQPYDGFGDLTAVYQIQASDLSVAKGGFELNRV